MGYRNVLPCPKGGGGGGGHKKLPLLTGQKVGKIVKAFPTFISESP